MKLKKKLIPLIFTNLEITRLMQFNSKCPAQIFKSVPIPLISKLNTWISQLYSLMVLISQFVLVTLLSPYNDILNPHKDILLYWYSEPMN